MSNVTIVSNMFSNSTKLKTIYSNNTWNIENISASNYIFFRCTSLEGRAGTKYYQNNSNDVTYVPIDGGESNPRYFATKTN